MVISKFTRMKKSALLLSFVAGTGQLMAQSNYVVPKSNLLDKPFISKIDTTIYTPSLKDLTKLPPANNLGKIYRLENVVPEAKAISKADGYNMPIVMLSGKSNMPICKLEGIYNMPVVVENPKAKKVTPAKP